MTNPDCAGDAKRQCARFTKADSLWIFAASHTSGLVLRRPVTRSPGFHWPRFLRIATRSKRLRTFRFAPEVLAARRLECCDITIPNQYQIQFLLLAPIKSGGRFVTRGEANANGFFEIRRDSKGERAQIGAIRSTTRPQLWKIGPEFAPLTSKMATSLSGAGREPK